MFLDFLSSNCFSIIQILQKISLEALSQYAALTIMSVNEDDWREEAQPTIKSEEPLKSSRLIKNDQKWEPLKEKIRRIYMVEDKTLPVTMNKIELEHGFKARLVVVL